MRANTVPLWCHSAQRSYLVLDLALVQQIRQKEMAFEVDDLSDTVVKLRRGQLLIVRGTPYRVTGYLGESSSTVLLTERIDTTQAVVKIPSVEAIIYWKAQTPSILLHEVRLTEYLESVEYTVPRILNFKPGAYSLVKEYFEGLTYKEIQQNAEKLGVTQMQMDHLHSLLKKEQQNYFQNIRPGFLAWLKNAYPEEFELMSSLEEMALEYDSQSFSNFLFDPRTRRWVLFDP